MLFSVPSWTHQFPHHERRTTPTYIWAGHFSTSKQKRNKKNPINCWNIVVLCVGHWQHYFTCPQRHSSLSNSSYWKIRDKCQRLLDYFATYSHVSLRYHRSNMQLHVDSDAAYLVAPKARSRVAGFYYFKEGNDNLPLLHGNHSILSEHQFFVVEWLNFFFNFKKKFV